MERHIRESNLIEGIDDVAADRQAMRAWKWLESQPKLTATVIKTTHRILTQTQTDLPPEDKGNFRTIQVYVGSHVPPAPQLIKKEMGFWLKNYKLWTPKEAHVRFETIHPFRDGNGRVGRLLMWWMQRRRGEEPILLKAEERWSYYAWFKGRGNPLEQTDIFGALSRLRNRNIRDL